MFELCINCEFVSNGIIESPKNSNKNHAKVYLRSLNGYEAVRQKVYNTNNTTHNNIVII